MLGPILDVFFNVTDVVRDIVFKIVFMFNRL